MTDHLVIPDAHAKPGQSLDRFKWLGEYIMDTRPDKIICLGDFADMESLCSYDEGKKGYYARSYKQDIQAVIKAQELMFGPMKQYNAYRRKHKKSQYRPELHMCYGNHENRINRAVELDHVILEGMISLEDLQYKEFGWKTYPFLEIARIDGINYSHYFISGNMGRPISGEHPAASLIRKMYESCTCGHSHVYDLSIASTASGKHIRALVAGCYIEDLEEYAGPANALWRRGVYMKRNVKDGDYSLEEISLQTLKETYG